jgi:hypothetical protein
VVETCYQFTRVVNIGPINGVDHSNWERFRDRIREQLVSLEAMISACNDAISRLDVLLK